MALVAVKNLSFTYPGADVKALDDLSFTLERGEFVTLMGATGSGKSTLLRLLKPELRQNGTLQGSMIYDGTQIERIDARACAERIGYVGQFPEEQIVTDKVWHELAFTLENLGAKRGLIARRVAEIAAYFDMDGWMERDTATLSGGEKQLLNLAAVMTADPQLLLLDEPTAQLDPIAASRFIATVHRLSRETGVTVLLCEHRCEELFALSDRIMMMDGGRLAADDVPRSAAERMGEKYAPYLPAAARLYHAVGSGGKIPLSVREGQRFIEGFGNTVRALNNDSSDLKTEEALSLKRVSFSYTRGGADILSDLELTVYRGEVFALLGANGAGKSTAAAVIAGLRKPYAGTVKLFGKRLKEYKNGSLYSGNLSLLPQEAQSVFLCETVKEELKGCEAVLQNMPFDLEPLFDRHPYDLSGGERQLVALCKALRASPRFLIMDEPSKGLDAKAKATLSDVIQRLKAEGVTVLLITHDVEFAAMCADRCALFAQGRIAAVDATERFMSENRFYTTAASRMTRRRYDGAYTVERAVRLIEENGGAV